MKRLISLFLALILAIGLIPASVLGVSAAEALSGSCGENAVWAFDPDTGTLTISGTGACDLPLGYARPWEDLKAQVVHVVMEDGITETGVGSFAWIKGRGLRQTFTIGQVTVNIPLVPPPSSSPLSRVKISPWKASTLP